MPVPGEIDVSAFMAGFAIAESAMGAVLLALLPLALLRSVLRAAGVWGGGE